MHVVQHIQPIPVGKPDVQEHHIVRRVLQQHIRLRCRSRRRHAVAFFAKNLFERAADLSLIIHDQYVIHLLRTMTFNLELRESFSRL